MKRRTKPFISPIDERFWPALRRGRFFNYAEPRGENGALVVVPKEDRVSANRYYI